MFTIRDIKREDGEKFFKMAEDFYGGEACLHTVPVKNFENTLEECLRSKERARALMLEEDGNIVGYFLISLAYSNEVGGTVVWLEELYFTEEARGKGYGSRVFHWVEEEYPEAKRFRLEATYENTRAISLYERLGYEELHYYQMIKDR